MIAPGVVMVDGRIPATIGPGIVPDFFHNGVGFMNDGSIAVDDDLAPVGDFYFAGFRRTATGAFYGIDFLVDNSPVTYIQGIPIAIGGGFIYNLLVDSDVFVNGNPVRNNSNAGLCLST